MPVVEGFSSLGSGPCRTGEVGCLREETDPDILDAPVGPDTTIGRDEVAATRLDPAWPNPFSTGTHLQFDLASTGRVKLSVYDVRGRLVRRVLDEERGVGRHSVPWDGRDEAGLQASPGIFFARLEAESFVGVRRIALVPNAK
jgi:hypothetical protein